MRLLSYLYFAWLALGFILGLVLLYPIFWVIMLRKAWHHHYYPVSRFWAWAWYVWCVLPVRSRWEFKPDKKQIYIFASNHFSYLDAPLLTLTIPRYVAFVGLHDLLRVPLLGKLFRTLHIPINRESMKDRYRTYQDCRQALQDGKCLVIFPEGGIWADESPTLMPFKEGIFRLAVELQTPIVPVTIPYNWHILSQAKIHQMRWRKSRITFHQPIETAGLTRADVGKLKEQVFGVIQTELQRYYSSK